MTNEPRGCLAFLFGFGGAARSTSAGVSDPGAGEEGNYHSGPGGYEGMGYSVVMPPSIAPSKSILMRAASASHA